LKIEEVKKIGEKLEINTKPLYEKINSISNILDYVKNAIIQNLNVDEVKNNIKESLFNS
jgi:hypothetical protein